jgi:glycyl-tRNA synthetase beta subunit
MADFLLEIGCEEIPARMIDAASRELSERVGGLLRRERLSAGEVTRFDAAVGGAGVWNFGGAG